MSHVPPAKEPSIEYGILRALEEDVADTDPGIMLELVDIFLDDSSDHLDAIEGALKEGNYRKIEISAHSLKSSSATFGALIFSNLCKRMEMCARTEQPECIAEMLDATRREFTDVKAILSEQRTKWSEATAE